MEYLYFDHAATTPMNFADRSFLASIYEKYPINASAGSPLAREALARIEETRSELLDYFKANSLYEFIFTSSATEANNTIIKGCQFDTRSVIYFNPADHASLTEPIGVVQKKNNCQLKELPLTAHGSIDWEKTLHTIKEDQTKFQKAFFFISHAHNITGIIEEIDLNIGNIRQIWPNIFFHFDGAQSVTKTSIDLSNGMIDSFTVSGHKFGAPIGVGGFLLKKKHKIEPLLHGGKQENQMRASTYNHPAILTFGAVIKRNPLNKIIETAEIVRALKNKFIEGVTESGLPLYFPFENKNIENLPHLVSLITPNVPAEVLVRQLADKNIIIAAGSACSDKNKDTNRLPLKLGIKPTDQKSLLRISFALTNSMTEVQLLTKNLLDLYQQSLSLADLRN